MTSQRRLLLVHAHPDDESSQTGATMARYAAEGALVTLVTCTAGEEGDVVTDHLKHLERTEDLGAHRLWELSQAMQELGVTDFVRLGGDGAYRDSGMAYDASGHATAVDELHANAFWRADLLTAANDLVPIIRDRRPHVLITYNEFGGYGHPDHVMAHRVALYATTLAGVPSYRRDLGEAWAIPRVLWSTMNAEDMRAGIRAARDEGITGFWDRIDLDGPTPPMWSEPADIVAYTTGSQWNARKLAALGAHASQVDLGTGFWRFFVESQDRHGSGESFRLVAGRPYPGTGPSDDLFAGLDDID